MDEQFDEPGDQVARSCLQEGSLGSAAEQLSAAARVLLIAAGAGVTAGAADPIDIDGPTRNDGERPPATGDQWLPARARTSP